MEKVNTIYTSDTKMLLLIDILKSNGSIKRDYEFCDAIGLNRSNLPKLKNGVKHFTPEHIEKAIINYKINANWIFGISEVIFLKDLNNNTKILVHKKVHRSA